MKKWKQRIWVTMYGTEQEHVQVRELTDKEATKARERGHNVMQISTGFVCLYQRNRFIGVCGSNHAKECAIKGRQFFCHSCSHWWGSSAIRTHYCSYQRAAQKAAEWGERKRREEARRGLFPHRSWT